MQNIENNNQQVLGRIRQGMQGRLNNQQESNTLWDVFPGIVKDDRPWGDVNANNLGWLNNNQNLINWHNATNTDQKMRVAIRGDQNCGKRSLMWGTLIEAATRIKSGDVDGGRAMLNQLTVAIGRFNNFNCAHDGVNQATINFRQLNFTPQAGSITDIIARIRDDQITVIELVSIANGDFSAQLAPVPSLLSLGLSALASFIIMEGASDVIEDFGMNGINGGFVDGEAAMAGIGDGVSVINHLLSLSTHSTIDLERMAFANKLGLKLETQSFFNNTHNVIYSNQNPGPADIILTTKTGHSSLVLSGIQQQIIQQEVAAFRLNNLPPSIAHNFAAALQLPFQMPPQAIPHDVIAPLLSYQTI